MRVSDNKESIPTSGHKLETKKQNPQPKIISTKMENSQDIINKSKSELGYRLTVPEQLIIDSINKANIKMTGPRKELEFSIHNKTKQIMVKVIDRDSKEVLRELPPEKVLDMVAHLCEVSGIFLDEKR